MNEHERDEARIIRLLGAVRSPADPAVLARARARITGLADVPRVFAWLGTPAALAAACMVLLVATGASLALLDSEATMTTPRDTTLVSALIGDDGSYGLPTAAATGAVTTDAGAVDSEKVNR